MNMSKGFLLIVTILLLSHPILAQDKVPSDSLPATLLSTDIQNLDGTSFRLSEIKGQVAIVLFWASWCQPCRLAADSLNAVYEEYAKRNVEIIGLTPENPKSDRKSVRKFVQDNKIRFKIGWIDKELAKAIVADRAVIPQILVIANDGRVVKRFLGYNPRPQKTLVELNAVVDQFLTEQNKTER